MRSVDKGDSPRPQDFENYRDALPDLVARLGLYCSYCERTSNTDLAVEHIQPQSLHPDLEGRWDNFLRGCVNCNSTKGDRDVVLSDCLLPDRDNTFAAYVYLEDGRVETAPNLTPDQSQWANETLHLTGLDQQARNSRESNGELVALDRVGQRMQCWLSAEKARETLASNPTEKIRRLIATYAAAQGFFSIWMAVFSDDVEQRRLFIHAFRGTATDCFADEDNGVVSPRRTNRLTNGGKL